MPEQTTHKTSLTCNSGATCQFNEEILSLKNEIKDLSELVSTDTLTGLNNYRFFTGALNQEIERSQRTGQPTTLMLLDADHFKKVNDQWGHEAGNQALKILAKCIKENIRKLDVPCRYGGEEFTIILPSTDIMTSLQVAERIRKSVEASPVEYGENTISITISIGISSYKDDPNDSPKSLIERADNELYRAKQQGRNQVCYSSPDHVNQQVNEDEKSAIFDIFNDHNVDPTSDD